MVVLSSDGSEQTYGTFFGGTGNDGAWDIALNSNCSANILGNTESADFPVSSGTFGQNLSGLVDTFVLQFDMGGDLTAQTRPASRSLGLSVPVFDVDIQCGVGEYLVAWTTDPPTTMVLSGTFLVLDLPPEQTTNLEVTVTDGGGGIVSDRAVLLVAFTGGFDDFNGDGCNDLSDLWELMQFWLEDYSDDPNGDDMLNVLDLLYIDTSGQGSCP